MAGSVRPIMPTAVVMLHVMMQTVLHPDSGVRNVAGLHIHVTNAKFFCNTQPHCCHAAGGWVLKAAEGQSQNAGEVSQTVL